MHSPDIGSSSEGTIEDYEIDIEYRQDLADNIAEEMYRIVNDVSAVHERKQISKLTNELVNITEGVKVNLEEDVDRVRALIRSNAGFHGQVTASMGKANNRLDNTLKSM